MKLIQKTAALLVGCFFSFLSAGVKIDFASNILPAKEVIESIQNDIPDPQIILWYSGESGLKERGATFYKNIFNSFLNKEMYHFHLYDLEAWKALRNSKASVVKKGAYTTSINKASLAHFSAIGSHKFFKYIKDANSDNLKNYVNTSILDNKFIFSSSIDRVKSNLSLKQALRSDDSLMSSLNELDTALAYSPLQYLEGLFLVNHIVKKSLELNKSSVNIVFLLPNDEAKYYKDDLVLLNQNIDKVLELDEERGYLPGLNDCKITISFMFFEYGNSLSERPYISREKSDKLIKPNKVLDYIIE